MIRAGSSWCDLAKHADGRVEFVHAMGARVICEHADSGAPRWSRDTPGGELLYLTTAADRLGRVAVGGKSHDDGHARFVIEGREPLDLGEAFAIFCVLVVGQTDGWTVFIQRSPTTYTEEYVNGDGQWISTDNHTLPATSQGFAQFRDGQPVRFDDALIVHDLSFPSRASRVWAGQSRKVASIALYDEVDGRTAVLGTPGGQPPHIVESGGTFYVCSYVEGGAWLSTHRRPFAAAQPPPDPKPEPDPKPLPEERPVQLEAKHSQLIQAFADQFGLPGFSKEEGQAWVAKLAGTMKARWPSEGWGTKRASPGRPLSNESVARPANGRLWGYDLIIGAGAPGQRLEPRAHPEDITEQVFVEVESRDWLAGGQQPGPNPTPNPTPTPGFTFPAGVEMPEDVALSLINFYLEGIRERDKIRAQDVVPSRGALMYLFAVFFRELSSWIVEKKRAPQGAEWWAVGDRIGVAAVKHYQDRQGVD
jgi:hypothetical protein